MCCKKKSFPGGGGIKIPRNRISAQLSVDSRNSALATQEDHEKKLGWGWRMWNLTFKSEYLNPQIIHFKGVGTIIFTIHFGGFPPILETPIYFKTTWHTEQLFCLDLVSHTLFVWRSKFFDHFLRWKSSWKETCLVIFLAVIFRHRIDLKAQFPQVSVPRSVHRQKLRVEAIVRSSKAKTPWNLTYPPEV